MTDKEENSKPSSDINFEFDFDELMALAQNDSEHFEEIRQTLLNNFIDSLPAERQHRMKCLQWRIDRVRDKSKTPLASCMAITEMMWESFEKLNTLFMEMKKAETNPSYKISTELETADILNFQTIK